MEYDLLNIPDEVERRRHKLKRTVPAPNSYFMSVKDQNNGNTPIYSIETRKKLATPTGGKVKLTKDVFFKINNKEQEIPSYN